MTNEGANVVAEGWITTSEAIEATGYVSEYLRQLARAGKIEATKFAGRWLYNEAKLLAYKQRMDALGRAKYDPRGVDRAMRDA